MTIDKMRDYEFSTLDPSLLRPLSDRRRIGPKLLNVRINKLIIKNKKTSKGTITFPGSPAMAQSKISSISLTPEVKFRSVYVN